MLRIKKRFFCSFPEMPPFLQGFSVKLPGLFFISFCCMFFVCAAGLLYAESAGETAWPKYVIDGDTLVLKDGRHVRYIGINAPETPKRDKKGEPYGNAAKKFHRHILKSGNIRLEYDRERKDHYGRTLAWIWMQDGSLLNELLLREGYAHCLYDKKNHKYWDRLLDAQQKAMKEKKGIWKDLYRKKGKVLGHTGSRRFHDPRCDIAGQIAARNRKWFKSPWQAYLEGYSPSKKCSAAR